MTDRTRVNQLLSMAYTTNSTARVIAIAEQILELEPDNPEALMLKSNNTRNTEKRIDLLKRALDFLNRPENAGYEDREFLLFEASRGLAMTYFAVNKFKESLKYCRDALELLELHEDFNDDADFESSIKPIYYRVMIELRDWQGILTETMRDEEHTVCWAYARLIAAYMLAPNERARKVCVNMFWDFLRLAPDAPFYMLGYFEEPDDDAGSEVLSAFQFALVYYDTLNISEEFLHWFERGVILFGLLSNRFSGKEHDYMIDALDVLGGYEDYERMSKVLVESDDEAVIEMLSANKCLTE